MIRFRGYGAELERIESDQILFPPPSCDLGCACCIRMIQTAEGNGDWKSPVKGRCKTFEARSLPCQRAYRLIKSNFHKSSTGHGSSSWLYEINAGLGIVEISKGNDRKLCIPPFYRYCNSSNTYVLTFCHNILRDDRGLILK